MNERSLAGRVAVVTGAGKGIGEATAKELACRGAAVSLAARTTVDLNRLAQAIQADGGQALAVPTDVTCQAAVENLMTRTLDRFGRLDVLVNNAGAAAFGNIVESDPDAWWRIVEVNLRGMYLCSRFVLPTLLAQGSGHIVNILSIASVAVFPGGSAYGAAKAGGLMFSRALAAEVRARGVRVTSLLPGSTRTPFWEQSGATLDLSKMMSPERVAEAVAFVLTRPDDATVDELNLMPPLGIL